MTTRAEALADRIEKGAVELAHFARHLSDAQWRAIVPRDGRSVGTIVHHVGFMYAIEMDVIRAAMTGAPVTEVTWAAVASINAEHAKAHPAPSKDEAIALVERNSKKAAQEVRGLNDEDLAVAVPFSLSYGAPMTVQFIIEDHPLRHSWHHLAGIRAALAA